VTGHGYLWNKSQSFPVVNALTVTQIHRLTLAREGAAGSASLAQNCQELGLPVD
jgi:hypothetical protein